MRTPIIARSFHEDKRIRKMIVVNVPTSLLMGLYRHAQHPGELGERQLQVDKRQLYFTEQVGDTSVVEQLRCFPRENSRPLFYRGNCLLHDRGLIRFLKKKIDELEMKNLVLWLNNPLAARFIGKFGEKLSVYNAVDDWSLHPQLAPIREHIERGAHIIKERADLVFAVSSKLVDSFNGNDKKAYLIPNGVDLKGYEEMTAEPEDLSAIERPRVGYVGSMQERFDVGLFERIVRRTPEVSYVLIGPVFSPRHFEPLTKYKNVHFLGTKNKQAIPAYIKGFDVCVLPHTIDDFTKAMDPIKLYEYLAAGKPTICTPIPSLTAFQGLVDFASDEDSFIHRIKNTLSDDGADKKTARIAFAQANSWASRIEEIFRIMGASM